jgi:hypothetical protein
MQLVITEKQLKMLSSQLITAQDIKEADDPAAAAPDSGTSSDGEKKTGATKWESGVTRGPANQIGVTKWSDVVGSTLKRGKANPLSEQETNSEVKILRPDGKIVNAPPNTKIIGLFDANSMDGSKFKDSLKNFIPKEKGGLGNAKTGAWIPEDWSKIIKLNSVSQFQTPDKKIYKAIIKHPKLSGLKGTWYDFYALTPEPNGWKFAGYFPDGGNEPFVGSNQVSSKTFSSMAEKATKASDYVYKYNDGENFFVNLMNAEFAEALLDLRSFIFTAGGMATQTVIEVAFSESVVIPIAIEAINAAIVINDIQLLIEQGDRDPDALFRVIEDVILYLTRGTFKFAGKKLKVWLQSPAGKAYMKTIAEKLVTVITNMKGLINKLPNSKLKEYVVSKVGNLDYLHKIIGKVAGATIAKIPQRFRKAIFSGLLVYISVKGLNKLMGVEEGTVESEMAKPEGPGDEVTAKLESISKPTIDSADVKKAEDLNILVKNNDKKKYAVEYAGFLKDEYPCLQTFLDAGKFEVIAVTEEKALFTINGEEYYNDQTGGIYKTSTEEIFECL